LNAGIYVIENSVTGHCYIGSAMKFEKRRREHFGALRRGDHRSVVLQRAYDKHGAEVLTFRPLLVCSVENLLFYEQRAIDVYRPAYNICKVAGSRLGSKYTEESRALLSSIRKGKPRSEAQLAHLARMTEANRGRVKGPLPDVVREKIRATLQGRTLPEEHKAAIGRSHRGMKRPPFTEQHKQAMRDGWARRRAAKQQES
jgi:group I intron endonuclease